MKSDASANAGDWTSSAGEPGGTDEVRRGRGYEPVPVRFETTVLGVLFIINAVLVNWLFEKGVKLGDTSAMIGAILLMAPIVWTAVKDIRRGLLTINELVAIAVLGAFAQGEYKIAGIVAFLMLIGEIIETRTAAGARASIESLIKLTPTKARRLAEDGSEEEVPVQQLKVGDTIRVRPGDNVAADGVIVRGQGSLNQATITGESLPVDKRTDDEVFAGTQNLTGVLEIRVTRAGQETTLGKVRELILSAEKTKLPIMRIIDQYMGYYTPLVLVVAGVVFAFTQDWERVISVLVVACPGAFILATPTAMVAALSAAARLGILIKKVSDIELAAKINAFIFDKTGTLTTAEMAVSRLAPTDESSPAELLRLAATAEKYSNHPTAKALAQLASEAEVTLGEPEEFSETAGRGIAAKVEDSHVLVGRAAWLRENGITQDFEQSVDLDENEGYSLIFVSKDGEFVGWIALQDQTRDEAQPALNELKEGGARRIAMITGDRKPVAARVGKEIGCEEVAAECLPQHKVDFVSEMRDKGYRVAVIGDGVNDAPALAAGDIGIAMGAAGSEVAIHSATVALMNNDLRRVPFFVGLSRHTRTVINQNFLLGVFFIIGGLILAALGYLSPIVAALWQITGSIIVIFNSARLVREGEELEPFEGTAQSGPENELSGKSETTPQSELVPGTS